MLLDLVLVNVKILMMKAGDQGLCQNIWMVRGNDWGFANNNII